AYQALKHQNIYNDSIFSVETNTRIASIESVFEIERQKNQITLLNQKNALKEERIKQQRILMITLALVIILSMFNLFLLRQKNKKLHEAQRLLVHQNEELQQSKEQIEQQANALKRLSTIAHKTINAVMILKPNGDIEWVNDSFTRLYGYTLDEFKAEYHFNLTQVSRDPEISAIIKEAIYSQKPEIYNVQVKRSDGSPLWIQTSITPIYDENGELDFFVAIDTDITSLKEYEANLLRLTQELKEKAADLLNKNEEIKSQRDHLIELNHQLQQKNDEIEKQAEMLRQTQIRLIQSEKMASVGNLIAGIAHEINNPTNFVYVGASLLEKEFSYVEHHLENIKQIVSLTITNEEKIRQIEAILHHSDFHETLTVIHETLKDIVHGAERTAEIIRKMQFYSRFEHENWQRCNINQIINNLIQTIQQKSGRKIEFITNYQNTNLITSCLLSRISAALNNILQNAVEASGDNGKIEIITQKEAENIIIKIVDSGKGIEPEELKKIFDPFYTTKPIGEGIGLGLTISYGIIKEHGGNITVHSTPNVGTTVSIELPIVENRA
ncbi:MAG TPA: ATP-binding protein, partial [Salinivirgaceae bacterium]|nr:ATP-binding protein [Salinivirgaceae bacterium]